MRVTDSTNYGIIRGSIQRAKEKMENLQQQNSTLRKVNQPSDDPAGAAKILALRTEKTNNDQYYTNAKMADSFLSNTESALEEISDIVARAKEIAISQSSSASSSADTRIGVSEEVSQLFKQAVATGNRRIGDRYLFGGYKTQTPPFDGEGEYHGDDGQMMIEISNDVFISMNLTGKEAFNTHPDSIDMHQEGYQNIPENINLFNELNNFRIALLTGNLDAIRNTLDRFDQLHGTIVAMRAKLGSRMAGLESTITSIERRNLTNANLSSSLEDADMAQVVTELSKEEAVLRNSLESSKRLIQPTLLDFLK